ncbi:MAG: hypothetical protein ACXADY_02855 [Candidatus Hodarchaeales archaeon]|jgi:hypothetical protein
MSLTMMFQQENKKTLGGYLWIFITIGIIINLSFFEFDLSDPTAFSPFISRLLLISSPLALAAITLRPEKIVTNKLLFRNKKIFPHYVATKNLSIAQVIDSIFLTKEYDNFWGNGLIAIGLFIFTIIPLINSDLTNILCFIKVGISLICLISSLFIGINWGWYLRKDFRDNIEITWRYMEIISQTGWGKEYEDQVEALEQSMRLRLWDKAKYRLEELDKEYKTELEMIERQSGQLLFANYFLCGDLDQESNYSQFPFYEFKGVFHRVKILGLEYHNKEIYTTLQTIVQDYEHLKRVFDYYSNFLNKRLEILEKNVQNFKDEQIITQNSQTHRNLQVLISKLSYCTRGRFHSNLVVFNFPEFNKVRDYVLQNNIIGLTHWFKNRKTVLDFINNIIKTPREAFNKAVQNRLGNNPGEEVHNKITKVSSWISDFLCLMEKDADLWLNAEVKSFYEVTDSNA